MYDIVKLNILSTPRDLHNCAELVHDVRMDSSVYSITIRTLLPNFAYSPLWPILGFDNAAGS